MPINPNIISEIKISNPIITNETNVINNPSDNIIKNLNNNFLNYDINPLNYNNKLTTILENINEIEKKNSN